LEQQALAANNTTAADNVAIGRKALFTNTEGTANTAVGETALYANTTASNNTAVGRLALTATPVRVTPQLVQRQEPK
jgi:hypothetical protein